MLLPNLKVTVAEVTDAFLLLKTEQGQTITVPKNLMPGASEGMQFYLAADGKPLVSADTHAKDVLNEVMGK
ncbi:MAG: hypothetical protein AAB490_04215 [Patescibacteria group bacterium]